MYVAKIYPFVLQSNIYELSKPLTQEENIVDSLLELIEEENITAEDVVEIVITMWLDNIITTDIVYRILLYMYPIQIIHKYLTETIVKLQKRI